MKTETIAAIATAMSDSGIGIVRISGKEALAVADKIYCSAEKKGNLKNFETHTIHYGYICDGDDIVDEVMVSVMKAPRSYTTEDTVEINCHGGILIMNRILELVLKNGARLAEPGEFTKRAFLNGRIDLSRAEAVMDLIHSRNEFALKNSVRQLKGSIFDLIKKMREEILYEIAFIESALDDPEHVNTHGYKERLSEKTDDLIKRISRLLSSAESGKVLREGIRTVIAGKPNAGKSSFLNLLLGEERAIVTDVAGTTRDVLEETVKLGDMLLHLIDTAGIRNTDDAVEEIGVARARKYIKEADLLIYVVDSSVPLDENDEEMIRYLLDKNTIILLNKTDLNVCITEENIKKKIKSLNGSFMKGKEIKIIKTSTKENVGMDCFEKAVRELFFTGKISVDHEVFITNIRHKEALQDAYRSMLMVKESLSMNMPEDFYSIDLMSAYTSLGYIIGEEVGDDLVNEIFSRFCMGK